MSSRPAYAPVPDSYFSADLPPPPRASSPTLGPSHSAASVPYYDESASLSFHHDPYGDYPDGDGEEAKPHAFEEEQALTNEKIDPLQDPLNAGYPPPPARHVQYG